ncbi:MAG: type III pantothenate kinase, partial [Lentisphaerae bacterium]|nr:type III pantothenate kinase [Lentisphaerota bacterium]
MKCLVVDVGNTSTAIGVYSGGKIVRAVRTEGGNTSGVQAVAALERAVLGRQLDGGVLASVVPTSIERWSRSMRRVIGKPPLHVSHRLRLNVQLAYPKPATIGADRIANACAAVWKFGSPVIVADFGTALTFDLVAEGDKYVGGVIAPGLPLMTDYLAERTALLPHIRLSGQCGTVGRSTAGAMRIGAHVGYRGIVREIVAHVGPSLGSDEPTLCATGGYAEWALKGLD